MKSGRPSRRKTDAATTKLPASRRARYEIQAEEAPRVRDEAAATEPRRKHVVSATEAARNFSDLISRVCYKGEIYIVERGGKAMCELSPVGAHRCTGADLLTVLATLTRPAEEFLTAVEEITRRQALIEPSAWEK